MTTENFTASQSRAATSDHPTIACIAGPGSGKTTVLTARIKRIINEGLSPAKVVALTYTNDAARHLESKLSGLLLFNHSDEISLGFCGTLHGFALRMLKDHGAGHGYGARTSIIDEEASAELLESRARSLGVKEPASALLKIKRLGRPSGSRLTPAQLAVASFFDELREAGILDFDLILSEFLRLLRQEAGFRCALAERFTHLFVDEVQDSAEADWAIYTWLPIANKFLVGDPDQGIYGFRGGRQDMLAEFARAKGVQVITLEENFRSLPTVCAAANRLIGHNAGRLDKNTVSARAAEPGFGKVYPFPPAANEGAEIAAIADAVSAYRSLDYEFKDMAVLARSNHVAAAFAEALEVGGVPVARPPRPDLPPDWPLARALIELLAQPDNDTLAFFYHVAKKIHNGADHKEARAAVHQSRLEASAQGKTLNALWTQFPRDCSLANAIEFLDREHLTRETIALVLEKAKELPPAAGVAELALEVARADRGGEAEEAAGVTVTTIHAAKGREWEVVFLVGFEDEATPGRAKSADVEEERRVAFVGITRAKRALHFSCSATRRATWGYKPLEPRTPSRFIAEAMGGAS